jgi:hypothetical protein
VLIHAAAGGVAKTLGEKAGAAHAFLATRPIGKAVLTV